MVVGYSLGNRNNQEDDIKVLGEDAADTITFSKALPIVLSRICKNACPYCGFRKKKDSIIVPYTTIKTAKHARCEGAREAIFIAGERPDSFPHIRALLDLWGFDSYLDYVYTVCELAFLEGLIPVIDIGFLSPLEMRKMSEICALVKIMVDTLDDKSMPDTLLKNQKKRLDVRLKSLEWAGKLKFPTATGLMVGIGESKDFRRETLNRIADLHKQFGHIHEVIIHNFIPKKGTSLEKTSTSSKKLMLDTVDLAFNLLPKDISIIVPFEHNPDISDFIKAGIRDLGRILINIEDTPDNTPEINFTTLEENIEKLGFKLQQRFPLRKKYIKNETYSRKLGQVFDSYKYKIKKEEQEKTKEAKIGGHAG